MLGFYRLKHTVFTYWSQITPYLLTGKYSETTPMTLDGSCVISYEVNMTMNDSADWQFDQGRKVGAVTTKQVIEQDAPVLVAIHYGDDCSWAFLCDTTEEESDSRMVTMGQMVELDPTLNEIADMQPGWIAYRDYVNDEWERFEEE